jgi:membrane fusion protein, macrolide-specific efflux system
VTPKILRGDLARVSGMPAALGSLRRPAVAVNAVLALLLAGGAFWAYETLSGPATGTAANASVRSVPVQQGTVTATVTADGSVESASTASASFVTGGTVTSIAVHVGDKVKKGQVLAKVDPAPAQRTLSAAEADLAAARDALARAEDAGSDTSSAQNEVTRAQLAVDEAQAGVDGTVLEAPMAGTVVAVNGTLGSSSQPSAQQGSADEASGFIDLADLGKLQVTAAFAEADATKLKEKQVARITWNALSGAEATGRVTAIDPSATTSNSVVTYGVTVSVDKIPTGAKVGQTVSVSVTTGSVANAVYVNSAAVTTVGNRHTVTVLNNGVQQVTPVEIGLEGDEATQITSGVEAGQQVVLKTTTTSTSGTNGFPGGGNFPGGGQLGGGGNFGGGANRGTGGGR